MLLGLFIGLGILSKYLFIYLVITIEILFLYLIFKKKKIKSKNCFIAGLVVLIILSPHILWLVKNDYSTFTYALERTGGIGNLKDHLIFPLIFFGKQLLLLTPFLLMIFFLVKSFQFSFNLKNEKIIFLTFIVLVPIFLIFITSIFMGARIRTMWMTPFYLFLGVFFIQILKEKVITKNFEKFLTIFFFLFILSPVAYFGISILNDSKRTAYPGKEISRLVENKWNQNFRNEIKLVIGDEWYAGNLSYHLSSRPKWMKRLKNDKSKLDISGGVIYTGNPKILKKICPGVFGTIKPVGYCMIGIK